MWQVDAPSKKLNSLMNLINAKEKSRDMFIEVLMYLTPNLNLTGIQRPEAPKSSILRLFIVRYPVNVRANVKMIGHLNNNLWTRFSFEICNYLVLLCNRSPA